MNKKLTVTSIIILAVAAIAIFSSDALRARFTFSSSEVTGTITDGLVGHWTFESSDIDWATGTVTDASGQGNNGTVVGLATTTAPVLGAVGQALDFDGSSDQINLGSDSSLGVSTFTFASWVNVDTLTSRNTFYDGGSDFFNTWRVGTESSSGLIKLYENNSGVICASDTGLQVNRWYHVAVTYVIATGVCNIYIDGVFDATATSIRTFDFGSATYHIGTDDALNIERMDGKLDDVRIYNRVLSANEVADLYNKTGQVVRNNSSEASANTLTSGLVGYWSFESSEIDWATGTVTDASGQGNNGTVVGLATTTAPALGAVGQALEFDGVTAHGQYVTLGNPSSLQLSTFSGATWIKLDNLTGRHTPIDFGGTNNTTTRLSIENSTGQVRFFLTNIRPLCETSGTLSPNIWYHLAVTYNSSSGDCRIYIDGVLDIADTDTATLSSWSEFRIGDVITGSNESTDGVQDDVRIYNRVLSASEIGDLYNKTGQVVRNNSSEASTNFLTSGLSGYWTFDGPDTLWTSSTDGTATDKSGNGNTGTLTNMNVTTAPVIGKVGQALEFDGSADYVAREEAVVTNIPLTLCAWFKTSDIDSQQVLVGLYDRSSTDQLYRLVIDGATAGDPVQAEVWSTTFNEGAATTAGYSADTWHHACGVYAGIDDRTAYIDGGNAGSDTTSIANPSDLDATDIGRSGDNTPAQYFNGSIDDVRIYNRALSVGEVRDLYESGR